ncbi:hypothetical protein B0T19DRAFT_395383 [Cercophora scortea]|uniref:Uncharacterized protein n=1 Tax=Cercophora scortea TaxID=314031 RepID=A0AAE0MLM1_9PEZI|nr:hypothetical protein B0T19DRAFT_395383 [Cercophora scortea]
MSGANPRRGSDTESFWTTGAESQDPTDDNGSAKAKLHAPTGEIPKDAIRPNTGPSPEDVVRKKAEERRRAKKSASGGPAGSGKSRSSMSGFSSTSTSSRKGSVTFADDDFPFDGGWSK